MSLKQISKKMSLMPIALFGWIGIAGAQVDSTIEYVGDVSGVPKQTFYGVVLGVLLWLLRIFTILAVIAFIVAGVMFLLAGSNKDMAEKAKNGVTYSIIAIVVALSAYIIIILVDDLLWGGFGQ